jgi:NTE family protein
MAEKDMDYIIGVDMQDYLHKRDELNGIVRVLGQTTGFLNSRNRKESEELTDIWISPKIEGVGITSFERFDEIIEAGRTEARKHLNKIRALAAKDLPPGSGQKEKALPLQNFKVDEILIKGNESFTRSFVLGKLRVKEGAKTSVKSLERGMDQLYGSSYFETVDYSLEKLDSNFRLIIKLKENTSQQKLKLGINYSDDFNAALLINYTHRNLLFKNSRLSIDAALGDMPRGEINYFVDRGFIPTLGIKLRSNRFRYQSFINLEAVNQRIYQDYSLDLFLQSTIRDAYAIGGGMQIEHIDISQNYQRAGFNDYNQGFINYYGYIDFDSFDDANFPHEGFRLNAQYRIISERVGFETFLEPSSVINLKYEQVVSLSEKLTFIGQLNGVNTIGSSLGLPYQIYLGSMGQGYQNYIQSFVGHRFMELSGRNLLSARADINYEVSKNHFILAKLNYAKLENSFEEIFNSSLLLDGYSLGYAYNSLIGPLEIHFSTSTNHANFYTYVRLGFWF